MKRIWLLPLVLLLASGAMAQATAPPAPASQPPAKDVRLDKKVSLSLSSAELEDVLASMGKSSGVAFTAGNNDRDWRVRERKVTIYAKDTPVGTIKDELSLLLGYRVSREGKVNDWGYLYWQDLKAKQLEAELLAAAKVAAADRAMALRQSAMDSAEAALNMTPEDAMKLKGADPWTAYLGGTTSGRGFAELMSGINRGFPVERDLMLRGKRVDIPLSGMSSDMQAAADDSTSGGLGGMIRKMAGGALDGVTPSGVSIMPMGELGGSGMAGIAGLGGMAIITGTMPGKPDTGATGPLSGTGGNGIPLGIFPLTNSGSMVGGAFGKLLFSLDEGKSIQEATADLQAEAANPDFLAETMARESPTEKNPPTDPDLTREIEIKDMRNEVTLAQSDPTKAKESQGKMIEEISRAFGAPVLVESFHSSMPVGPFIKPGKQPLYMVLAGFEKAGYIWEKGNGTFRIRPEDWALQRSYEIPEEFIQKYKDLLAKQGEFTLDDIANIAYALTDDQIQNNLVAEPELTYALVGLLTPTGGSRDLLRVYGSLNNQQKVAIKSAQGLAFASLSNVQWDRLNTVISDKLGGVYINGGSIRLVPQAVDTSKSTAANAQMGTIQMAIFETSVQVGDEAQPRILKDVIIIYGKQQIAMMKNMRKSAQDAAVKANQQKKNALPKPPPAPVPVPTPAQ